MKKNIEASIRAKLYNISKKENIDFDFLLLRYIQDSFLKRVSLSKYSENFILKGGLLLFYMDFPYSRPTRDVDFLGVGIRKDEQEIKRIIKEISEIQAEDGVIFNPNSMKIETIREDTNYEGISVKIDGNIERAKKRIRIDIGFGDLMVKPVNKMVIKTILGRVFEGIRIYPIESIVSEKFEIMIKFSVFNSRLKDFYDIYFLTKYYEFKLSKVKEALILTFKKRRTKIPGSVPLVLKPEFYKRKDIGLQWKAYLNKIGIREVTEDFGEIVERIKDFILPVLDDINKVEVKGKERIWSSKKGMWDFISADKFLRG